VRDGDTIEFDVPNRELRVLLTDEEIEKRLADWSPPAPRYATGVFAKYAASVASASEGAITSPLP
jgi:dihydroxy-acid dehydratase